MQQQNDGDILVLYQQLNLLLSDGGNLIIADKTLNSSDLITNPETKKVELNPYLSFLKQQIKISNGQKKVEIAKSLPDITIAYFNQSIIGTQNILDKSVYFDRGKRFDGFQLGLSIPLFFGSHRSKIKSADIEADIATEKLAYYQQEISSEYQQTLQAYLKQKRSLNYYEKSALPNMTLIEKNSQLAYQNGEIGYQDHLLNLKKTIETRNTYLSTLNQFVQSKNKLEFLIGNPTR